MIFFAIVLYWGYSLAHAPSVWWAMVSAAMVLQPGFKASLAASVNRICANLIGAATALLVGFCLGDGNWQFLIALAAVIAVCTAIGFDQTVRTACVAVIVVMLVQEGHYLTSAIERAISVAVGCGLALGAEYATGQLGKVIQRNKNHGSGASP